MPHLQPPSATAYEEDRDALTAQFDAAEALLREIQADTVAVKAAVTEQKERVDKVTSDVETAVKEMRDGEVKTRDEMREVREEINNIREMLPKVCPLCSLLICGRSNHRSHSLDDREEQGRSDTVIG